MAADIAIIDNLADKKKLEMDHEKLMLINGISDVILPFIRKRRIIVYGGSAFNEILPPAARFYSSDANPDYDCFSINALRDARDLADSLHKNGFNHVHVKRAIHDQTFRVFAEFVSVADISMISKEFYESLLALARRDYDLRRLPFIPAPLTFLRFAMYNEMSKPRESSRRWHKVFARLALFNKYFPMKASADVVGSHPSPSFLSRDEMKQMVAAIKRIAITDSLPIGGMAVISTLLGPSVADDWKGAMGMIDLMSMDANATAEAVAKQAVRILKKGTRHADTDIIIETLPYGEFATKQFTTSYQDDEEPVTTVIMIPEYLVCAERRGVPTDRVIIASIYNGHYSCKSVYTKFSPMHMSWDTIMSILLGRSIVEGENVLKRLTVALDKKLRSIHVTDRISISCYGHTATKEEVMQRRWDDRLKSILYIPQ